MTSVNCNVFQGEWKNGNMQVYKLRISGYQGKKTYQNGDVYEGWWKDTKRHGQGVFTMANGSVYDGEWKDGRMQGKGVFTKDNGKVYEGEWKNGKKQATSVCV